MIKPHGILLVDKPKGITSHDVVSRVRRWLGIRSVGHAGTLDPMATGLLVLLIGEATKISDYLLNGDKAYKVRAKLGVQTDSLDVTGKVIAEKNTDNLEIDDIKNAIRSLTGELELPVPKFSAIKVNGEKLLDKTLKAKEFDVPTRVMTFFDLEILELTKGFVECEFQCTKGSYVRSWVSELGQILGCGATVESLRRTFSSPYYIDQALSLVEIESTTIENCSSFIPLRQCLQHWEAFTVGGRDERLMLNGQVPNELSKRLIYQQKFANQQQRSMGIRIFQASTGHLASLIEVQPNKGLKIKRVFRY